MYLWTSEAVSSGHPDKVADQIADSILDAVLTLDPKARVASEVTILKDFVLLSGEITTTAKVDFEEVARNTIAKIGYDRDENAFNAKTCEIVNKINKQSSEIAKAVGIDEEVKSGDQGIMFGYACTETPNFMPLSHYLAFQLIDKIEEDIAKKRINGVWESLFCPDAKSQVTIEYHDNGVAKRIHTIVVSVCHKECTTLNDLYSYVHKFVINPVKEKFPHLFDEKTIYLINPAGLWNVGGPASDTGLSGRKIVVDNYGADSTIGGGSFSGKDPTKVDRSAAYAARHIAKNIVASGIAGQATVQLSYAIGVAKPISVRVQAKSHFKDDEITAMVINCVDLTPRGIIERFALQRPIYSKTASGGHFGRDEFPWEQLDLVQKFKDCLYWPNLNVVE